VNRRERCRISGRSQPPLEYHCFLTDLGGEPQGALVSGRKHPGSQVRPALWTVAGGEIDWAVHCRTVIQVSQSEFREDRNLPWTMKVGPHDPSDLFGF